MAILGANALTILDIQKRLDKNDKVVDIIELLSQTNEMLMDIPWVEGDSADGLTASLRTGIPTPTWRRYNEFVQPTKSTVASVQFTCGMLENYSQIDVDLAARATDPMALRLSEAAPIIEGINQEVQRAMLYEDEKTNPGKITGLAPYYSSTTAESGDNIILGGGSGSDNTSIFLVCFGQGVHGIYPKGSKVGLSHWDLGETTLTDTVTQPGGGRLRVLEDRWQWKCGFAVRDWRQAVRIPNIDVSNLLAGTGADLPTLLFRALPRIKNPKMGKLGLYMNRTVATMLGIQARADVRTGGGMTYANVDGQVISSWLGIPVRICDQISNAETLVA